MQAHESGDECGLIYGYILNRRGGGCRVGRNQVAVLDLLLEESLWLHWDRGVPEAQVWLRDSAGLGEFACDLLLEEATRLRLLDLGAENLLALLRGVNLNPGAESEDMVSLRVLAGARRVISLRLRPLETVVDLLKDLEAGKGPRTTPEVAYHLTHCLTNRVDTLISGIADQPGAVEELVEAGERASPDQHQLRTLRRRSAGLWRYLASQRDIYSQLARYKLSWFVEDDADYWNELNNRLMRNLEELRLIQECISVLQEAESRRITERTNHTMYLLGIITGPFLPIGFVTGLLGINVGGILGANVPYGFWLACLLIGGVATFRWWVSRRLC